MNSVRILLVLFVLFAVTFVIQFAARRLRQRSEEKKFAKEGPHVRVRRSAPLPKGLPMHARKRDPIPEAPVVEIGEDLMAELREKLEEIPPVPVVVQRVLQEVANPKSSAQTVAKIAQTDPMLATTFLRAINSSAYGMARPIASVDQAISLLGYRTIQALVMQYGFSRLFPSSGTRKGYRTEDLWVHSLAVSLAAQALAERVKGVDAGLVATLGLLHDIGKFVIATKYPKRIDKLWAGDEGGEMSYLDRERTLFGSDHTVIGAHLAKKWQLPEELVKSIRLHHLPMHRATAQLPEPQRKAIGVVFLANQLAKYCHAYCEDVEIDLPPDGLLADLGLEGPLEALLTPAVKESITRAIHFVDQVTPTPLPAVQRLIGVKTARDLSGMTSIPRDWMTDPILERISIGEGPELSNLAGKETVRIDLTTGLKLASVEASTVKGAADLTIVVEPTESKMREVVADLGGFLERVGLSGEKRFSYRFLIKYALGNVLHSGGDGGPVEVRLRRGLEEDVLAFRHPGLAFRHLLPIDRLRENRGEDVARRISAALLGAGLGRILTLGWFDRIEANPDGDLLVLVG